MAESVKSLLFSLFFSLVEKCAVWNRIRIRNTDPDPQHWLVCVPGLISGLGCLALLRPDDRPVNLGVGLPAALRPVVVVVVGCHLGDLTQQAEHLDNPAKVPKSSIQDRNRK